MNSAKRFQKVRIFAASPYDVVAERAKLATVVEELKSLADLIGVSVELIDWRKAVPEMGRPEQVIVDQLRPTTWDLFIGILWHRFGTPPKHADPETGKAYLSGTEEEFKVAYRLWQHYKRPHVMFYWCKAPIPPDVLDPEQYRRVREFFEGFRPGGDHPGLYQTYDTPEAFERLVRQNLTDFLIRYSEQVKGRTLSTHDLQSAAPRPHDSLPRRTPFFGRKYEIMESLRALSPDDRGWGLVIDGIGGIGKTALAVEVAYICKDRSLFDSFVFVTAKHSRLEPSGIKEQALAETTLDGLISEAARALGQPGIAQAAGGELKQRALLDALRGRRVLLMFDNVESLSPAEQNRIGDFLRYLPDGCKAIVTSRRRAGEAAITLRLEPLRWEDARELISDLVARYPNVQKAFAKVGETAWKQLYDETGGSPLAMVWTIGLIQSRRLSFGRALALLRDGSMASDLMAFIYREARKTMDVNEWATLSALSLFEGSATFEALSAATNLERRPLDSVLERLRALSLADVVEGPAGEERYSLHELTRRFSRADAAADADQVRVIGIRFARYWVDYAERNGGDRDESYRTFHRLEAEWQNLEGAVNWLWERAAVGGEHAGDRDAARLVVRLAFALAPYLWFLGHWDEAVELNTRSYGAARALKDWSSAGWRALDIAWIAYERGDTEIAALWTDRCMEMWTLGGNRREQAEATRLRALITQQRQNYDEAERLLQGVLSADREFGEQADVAADLHDLGELAFHRQDYAKAQQYLGEGLEIAQRTEDKESQADHMSNLGELALARQQWAEARAWYEHALALAREIGRQDGIADNLAGLARVWSAQGRGDLALPMAQEALSIRERLGHRDLPGTRDLLETIRAGQRPGNGRTGGGRI